MRRRLFRPALLLLLALFLATMAQAQSSPGLNLRWHVLSSGGAQEIARPGYRLYGTLTQTAIGPRQNAERDLGAGYWYGIRWGISPGGYRVSLPLVLAHYGQPDLLITAIRLDPIVPGALSILLHNQGDGAASSFWIDGYLDPATPPEVNQPWPTLGCQYGLAWFVPALLPGQMLTLTVGGPYFQDLYSRWPAEYPAGPHTFWAYADSWGAPQPYGAVEELDEGNNRFGPLSFVGTGTDDGKLEEPVPSRPRVP